VAPALPGQTILAQTRTAESQAIRAALVRCGFNRLAVARELGLHKSTLFRKIRALGIDLPEQDGRSLRKRQ
jgi:transcriptional regulator of acetoin/glycerol metabolism